MALRDYSNGADPGLANLVNNINAQEEQRRNVEREHLEDLGKAGIWFGIGTLLGRLFSGR